MSRVLAVDWGTRRLGFAVSDPSRRLARSLPTVEVRSAAESVEAVAESAAREDATRIVIGLPRRLSGEDSASTRAARRLGEALEDRGFEVIFVDERHSSDEAHRFARERGERRGKKGRIDQLAAVMMLQEYLDAEAAGSGHA